MPKEQQEQVNERNPAQRSVSEEIACLIARYPVKWLLGSLAVSLIVTSVAVLLGNIDIELGTAGWESRGTLISERQIQSTLVRKHKNDLFFDEYRNLPQQEEASPWDFMINNIVLHSSHIDDDNYYYYADEDESNDNVKNDTSNISMNLISDECDIAYYFSGEILFDNNLSAMWGSDSDDEDMEFSILNPEVLLQICEAESNTNELLEEKGLCGGCGDEGCLPPYSLIFFLRTYLNGALGMTCSNLIELYSLMQDPFTDMLMECTNDIRFSYDQLAEISENITSCPLGFGPNFVDKDFGVDGNKFLRQTSSYFYTAKGDDSRLNDLYNIRGDFDTGDSNVVTGTYDTSYGRFNYKYTDEAMILDAWFASLAGLVTCVAMIIHTKSLWLSFIGLAQILLAVPMSFFVYHFIIGLTFFPMLNLIGLFVSAALGADDLFVATDKWKNARIKNVESSTEEIARVALPDAASAMFLTTSTTGVAFFATCICPNPPIFTFAVFCGLMIIFNYVLNCLLVFPALCIYDRWLMNGGRNCFVTFSRRTQTQKEDENANEIENEEKLDSTEENRERHEGKLHEMESSDTDQSLIHRILSVFYHYLHTYRWVIFVLSMTTISVSAYFASTISQPQQSEVRMLPLDDPLEIHHKWSTNLLSHEIFFAIGATVRAYWGIKPTDNGDHNNPDTISNLVLDENFDPSSTEAQEYLVNFCDRLFENEFVEEKTYDYKCEINMFDEWLQKQGKADLKEDGYLDACGVDAVSLPMAEDKFHSCIILWSKRYKMKNILSKDGVVKIIRLDFRSPIIEFSQPLKLLGEEWNKFENWFQKEAATAPHGVNQMFHASPVWWWYDTNAQMMDTAFGAAGITVGFSAVLVLLSSRSFLLTLFSGLCIFYVLAAATASLVLLDWELGFLESVCFAILIGISCDFVIHFGHAYSHLPDSRPKEERTKYALMHMGPSILAAAVTTMSAACVMLFCRLQFSWQFGEMLVLTMTHAVIGSFVVYFVLTDLFGPSQPSKSLTVLLSKCFQRNRQQ